MQSTGDGSWKALEQTGFLERYGKGVVEQVMKIASSSELSPPACGAGRLFDSVAALIGICDRNTFEGEAAMALESLTRDFIDDDYPVEFMSEKGYTVIDFSSAIVALIRDKVDSVPFETISTRFHNTVVAVVRKTVVGLRDRYKIGTVVLSGGTFQNLYLLTRIVKGLRAEGLQVFTNSKVPCNDGGISLGQAYIVRERLKNRNNA
jgi:hydrogenase maturation protein HypF